MSKVNSKETGGPGHLGDPGYENGEGGCPGGQRSLILYAAQSKRKTQSVGDLAGVVLPAKDL